jgi:hypothetical protein
MSPGRIPQNATSLLNAECPAWAGANLVDAPAVAQPLGSSDKTVGPSDVSQAIVMMQLGALQMKKLEDVEHTHAQSQPSNSDSGGMEQHDA